MNSIQGDLLQLANSGSFEVIVHGCNCFCEMNGGIAKTIQKHFPEAYQADLATERGSKEKLGSYSVANVQRNGNHFVIVNAYTQYHWSGAGILADYDAIRKVFSTIKHEFTGCKIAYPKIGAGLARGDWNIIGKIINEQLHDEHHTLVKFVQSGNK